MYLFQRTYKLNLGESNLIRSRLLKCYSVSSFSQVPLVCGVEDGEIERVDHCQALVA